MERVAEGCQKVGRDLSLPRADRVQSNFGVLSAPSQGGYWAVYCPPGLTPCLPLLSKQGTGTPIVDYPDG